MKVIILLSNSTQTKLLKFFHNVSPNLSCFFLYTVDSTNRSRLNSKAKTATA